MAIDNNTIDEILAYAAFASYSSEQRLALRQSLEISLQAGKMTKQID